MLRKWLFTSLAGTFGVIVAIIALTHYEKRAIYYNAYSLVMDEYYVVKSDKQLPLNTTVACDSNAVVGRSNTVDTVVILSLYNGNIGHY